MVQGINTISYKMETMLYSKPYSRTSYMYMNQCTYKAYARGNVVGTR